NSTPNWAATARLRAKTTAAPPSIDLGYFIAESRSGTYQRLSRRTTNVSVALTLRARISEAITGIRVIERIKAAVSADMKVNAIGRNILPSTPSRLRIGINTMITISPAKRIGVPTSLEDC